MLSIGIVIVTFNRLNKLEKALTSFENQTVPPDYIVVVNNASTDNTAEYLQKWKKNENIYSKYVINMSKNLGGSGGFYTGLQFAKNLKSDWIWLSDDDAYPEKDALEKASNYLSKDFSAICGMVINNNQIDTDHRRNYRLTYNKVLPVNVSVDEYSKEFFPITCFSKLSNSLCK